MPQSLSNSQVERLGKRLARDRVPTDDDLALLHQLLAERAIVLTGAVDRVRGALTLAPTARIKNTGTILEKLRRSGGSTLKTMQDLAGMRIVGDFNHRGQDELVAHILELFSDAPREARVVDRRADPVQGYRAVHVVVFPDGVPVEIQLRTRWQHEWAELFEKLADRVGRGIRYGEPPLPLFDDAELSTMPAEVRDAASVFNDYRLLIVRLAEAVADLLDAVERGTSENPDEPELPAYRDQARTALAELREALGEFEAGEASINRARSAP